MNSRNLSVDIILCCFNQQKYIAQAVESLLFQEIDAGVKVRVIVADDSSTDETTEIIRNLEPSSPFPFLYLPKEPNMGLFQNYHRAFKACSGDYVAILEGDDWWSSPKHLQRHIDFLQSHRRFSMSFNTIDYFSDRAGSHSVQSRWPYRRDYRAIGIKEMIVEGNQIGNLSSCVFRRKLLDKLPESFFQLHYADWELGIWMAQYGPVAQLRESTSVYRQCATSVTFGMAPERFKQSQLDTLNGLEPLMPHYRRMFARGRERIESGRESKEWISWKGRVKRVLRKLCP